MITTNYDLKASEQDLVSQTSLLGTLLCIIVLGNTVICALVIKFKNLRTFANFLVVEMAVTDLLNGIINIPLFIRIQLYPSPILKGREVAMTCLSVRRGFLVQNILSVLTIFIDRYLVLGYGLRYTHRKTRRKILHVITVKWLVGVVIVGIIMLFHSSFPELGQASVAEYTKQYEGNGIYPFARIILPAFLVIYCVVSILSWKEIRRADGFRKGHQQRTIKHFQDLKALKTVGYIIACYATSFLPEILRGILVGTNLTLDYHWLTFVAFYFLLLTSAVNCFIYYFRTERFRRALIVLLTTPFDKGDVVELKTFDPVLPAVVLEARKFERAESPKEHLSDGSHKMVKDGQGHDGVTHRGALDPVKAHFKEELTEEETFEESEHGFDTKL